MRLWQKIGLTVLAAVVFVWLGGCRKAAVDYGFYNLGVCGVHLTDGFIASTVHVVPESFSILASIDDQYGFVDSRMHPLVLKYTAQKGDLRVYTVEINGHQDEIDVVVHGGQLKGAFLVNGKLEANLHGLKGTVDTLDQDADREYQYCKASK